MSQKPVETYLKTAECKALNVLFWLLHNRDEKNRLIVTLDEVAKECNVTKVTVNRVFQRLYEADFLEKTRNGVYQLKNI